MRKFLLTFFFLTTLGILTVAVAVPVITKIIGPDYLLKVDPPEGAPFGDRDFPIPEQSRIAVRLELPLAELARAASHHTPRELSGVEKKNLHKKITDGVVQWRMWPGPVKVSNTGRDLTFFLPVAGDAYSTGKFGVLKIPVKGSANMEGVLSGRMAPYINSEWEVVPQIQTLIKIRKANMTLGKFGTFEAKDKVEAAVLPVVDAEMKKIGPALTKALNLKPGIQKLWSQAHVTKQISNEYQSWVVFDPGLAEMGPIDYSQPDRLSMTLGMVAQSFITNASPENRQPGMLPLLTPVPTPPKTQIRIPIIADLKSVNETLKDKKFKVKPKFGPKIEISNAKIDLAKTPGYLNVRMNVETVDESPALGLSGEFWIKGKPIIDCKKQTLGFTDVSLTVETREAISKTAAWLMEELLVKSIEAEVRFDLKEHLPKLEDEIYRVITSVPVPEQFELNIEKPRVDLLGVYTVNRIAWNQESRPGIVAVLGAEGEINVRMKKL